MCGFLSLVISGFLPGRARCRSRRRARCRGRTDPSTASARLSTNTTSAPRSRALAIADVDGRRLQLREEDVVSLDGIEVFDQAGAIRQPSAPSHDPAPMVCLETSDQPLDDRRRSSRGEEHFLAPDIFQRYRNEVRDDERRIVQVAPNRGTERGKVFGPGWVACHGSNHQVRPQESVGAEVSAQVFGGHGRGHHEDACVPRDRRDRRAAALQDHEPGAEGGRQLGGLPDVGGVGRAGEPAAGAPRARRS